MHHKVDKEGEKQRDRRRQHKAERFDMSAEHHHVHLRRLDHEGMQEDAEHQPRECRVEIGAADGSVEDYPVNLIRQARGFKNRVLFSPIFSLSI